MSYWNGHRWEAQTPPTAEVKSATPSRAKRVGVAVLEAALVTALTFGLIAGSAFAGKGGGGAGGGSGKHGGGGSGSGGGTMSLVLVADTNANGAPDWGDTVTFNVSTTATTQPNLDLTCKQNGTVVYGATTGFYAGYPWPWTQNMTLGSSMWTGGAASCTARLYAFAGSGTTTLATLSFTAGG
jgi:hypothetical protein